jgi:hypothetical protein
MIVFFIIMEQDIVVRISQLVPYPWVSRMDRKVYAAHPELDPVRLAKWSLIAGVAGYWLAKIKRWNRPMVVLACIAPLVFKFMSDEWRLKQELAPASKI